MRKAIFAASFDPPTLGHLNIIERSHIFCDKLIVVIAEKRKKDSIFSMEQRKQLLQKLTKKYPFVEVLICRTLLVDLAKKEKCNFFIRASRSEKDLAYEMAMAKINQEMSGLETIFLPADPNLSHIHASLIREIASFQGPLGQFVPLLVEKEIKKRS